MATKVIARPMASGEIVNKSRSVTGFNRWANQSRIGGFFMRLIALIALPFEVYLRRDFGERWFTPLNYFTGLFYLLIFFGIQLIILILMTYLTDMFSGLLSLLNFLHLSDFTLPKSQTLGDLFSMYVDYNPYITIAPLDMVIYFVTYTLLGQYHLFKIRWRTQAGIPLHSYDDGTSRLQWLANWLTKVLNVLAVPFMWLLFLLIPEKQRKGKKPSKLINDNIAFANTIVEPAIIFLLTKDFTGVLWFWCFISAVSVKVQAHLREQARNDKRLDFQDGKVEAVIMREYRNTVAAAKTAPEKKQLQKTAPPVPRPPIKGDIQYPPLQTIIDEMNG